MTKKAKKITNPQEPGYVQDGKVLVAAFYRGTDNFPPFRCLPEAESWVAGFTESPDVCIQRLTSIGCTLETRKNEWDDDPFGGYGWCHWDLVWKPQSYTLKELERYTKMQAQEVQKRRQYEIEHADEIAAARKAASKARIEEQERRERQACERERTALEVPEITDAMKSVKVDIGTVYVYGEYDRWGYEVKLTSPTQPGTYSRAAFRKLSALDGLVLRTLRLHPYDGDRPGSNLQGVTLHRPMDVANRIAELAGWNIRFKPGKVKDNLHSPS
jgi:hypothetical protein